MSAKLSRYDLEISKACRRFSNERQKLKKRVKPWITQISQTTEVTAVGEKPASSSTDTGRATPEKVVSNLEFRVNHSSGWFT
jgi:hypothetical protein